MQATDLDHRLSLCKARLWNLGERLRETHTPTEEVALLEQIEALERALQALEDGLPRR